MIVMGDKHPARPLAGRPSSGHADHRRHDSKPVFMFGTFGPDAAGSTLVAARHKSSLATKASGGANVLAHHRGSSAQAPLPSDACSAFMFGVHPE
jgi:hypothetical protein